MGKDAQNILLAEDQIFLAFHLDFRTGVLAEQDAVAGVYIQWNARAVRQNLAVAGGDDFALLRLFLGRIGNDDPAPNGLFF